MKIKTKLTIAFCIIIFVPILLATATIVGFCNFQAHAIEETYGIKNADAYSVINSVQLLNRYTVADFQKIQKKIQKDANELVNMTYLQELNDELKQKYSYLIIRRGSQLYYNGGSDNQIVVDSLPDYGSTGSEAGIGTYIDSDDELAGLLAHQISHGVDTYNGVLRGYISILNYWVAPNKYDLLADKRAVDYMVNAGYNPLGYIVILNKIMQQYRYDAFSNHTLITRRMMKIYEYIYTKYPSILVDNEYKDNVYYQNFLLISRNNRMLLKEHLKNGKVKNINYHY